MDKANEAPKQAPGNTIQVALGSRHNRHLPKAILLEEMGIHTHVKATIALVGATLGLFVAWASLAELEEVASAPGSIVPTSSVQVVQHVDGGTVAQLMIDEGQKVESGQVLMRLDAAEAEGDYQQALARYWGLAARAERLRAFAEDREPDFSPVPPQFTEIVRDQTFALKNQREAREDSAEIILSQIRQNESEIKRIDREMASTAREIQVLRELSEMRDDLAKLQVGTRMAVLEARRSLIVAEGQLERMQDQRSTTGEANEELHRRLRSLDSDLRRAASEELGGVTHELAQVTEMLARQKDRLARLDIRAPRDGVIQDLQVHSPGAVIAPGAVVVRIVPTDDVLEAEVRISTADVGHVRKGQPVRVKVSTYDFMRYGAVDGEVHSVSATSFFDENNQPYFKGVVRLERNHVGPEERHHYVMPGMSVDADIVTDQKTVLEYLMRPVVVAFREGMRER